MNTTTAHDHEIVVLENIYENANRKQSAVKQRNLAKIAGISLGMTNAILRRLSQKGWLTIRRINSRNIQYAVSPEGIEEIYRRSYRYLRRTIKNVVQYKEVITTLAARVLAEGYRGIVLIGESDIEFIVEHSCGKADLVFEKTDAMPGPGREDRFYLYAETVPEPSGDEMASSGRNAAFLCSILMGL